MTSKLPPELQAPKDEKGYSLLFAKGKRQWLVHLWSNQVVSCAIASASPLPFVAALTYKFRLPKTAKLVSRGFFGHGVAYREQRRRAVAEYARQIRGRLEQGYELVADSRTLDEKARARSKPRVLSTAQIAKLPPWKALVSWGTRYAASDDARVSSTATRLEDASEPAVRFTVLRRLPKTRERVVIAGDVTETAFKGKLLWIRGDLRVQGNLELGGALFVSGDLVVDGIIRDTREWTQLLVGGDVRAGAINLGSQLYVAGAIEAGLVAIDGTGELRANRLRARLLVEEGFDRHVRAKLHVKHRVDFTKSPERGVATLEKVLAPKLGAALRRELEAQGEDFYFPKRLVFDTWKARQRVWK